MRVMLHCRQCGLPFERRHPHQKRCSPECVEARRVEYFNIAPLERPCWHCGEVFTRRPGFRYLCSDACKLARKRERLRAKDKRRYANNPRYRARALASAKRAYRQMRAEGGPRLERYLQRQRENGIKHYHKDIIHERDRSAKRRARDRELILKGKALEQLQQEGLL